MTKSRSIARSLCGRICFLANLLVIILLRVPSVCADEVADIREQSKNSVVYITVSGAGKNGVPYQIDATGFLVSGAGEIITANHIFNDENGQALSPIKIAGWYGTRFDGRFRDIEVFDTAPSLDLALLRFKGNYTDYKPVRICPDRIVKPGDALIALGFPKGDDLNVINGILSSENAQRGWNQTNVDFIMGYSGGPVFETKTGSVVGIVMGGTPQAPGRNFYLPINRANGLLSQLAARPGCALATSAKTVTISDGNLNYGQSGFSFSHNSLVAWNSPDGDILVATTNPKREGRALLFLPNDQPPYDGNQDRKSRSGILQINDSDYSSQTTCPTDGYTYHWREAAVSDVYCIRARDGNSYHRIRIKSVTRDFISFEWQ